MKVTKIIDSKPVEGKYGPQFRTAFQTDDQGTKIISAFSKQPIKEGDTLNGSVEEKVVGDKTFYNFKFGAPKADAGLIKRVEDLEKKVADLEFKAM